MVKYNQKIATRSLAGFFLRGLSCLVSKPYHPVNGNIKPEKNFLLRKATHISTKIFTGHQASLYRLENGIFAVHEVFENDLVGEKLRRIEAHEMNRKFGYRLNG